MLSILTLLACGSDDAIAALQDQITTLQTELEAAETQVDALEASPAVDVGDLATRLAALEGAGHVTGDELGNVADALGATSPRTRTPSR